MSREQQTTVAPARRWLTRALVPAAAAVLIVAPGMARAGSDGGAAGAGDRDQMVAEAQKMEQMFVRLWNEKKWDEFAAGYVQDAIGIPPNHEPIHGGKAIAEYYKSVRDTVGELEGGTETLRATASGDFVSLVGQYSAYSGRVRFTTSEVYERQADGSLKLAVDMVGFRDPEQ